MPSYINPETGLEDPNIQDRAYTFVIRYAADDDANATMGPELVDAVRAFADERGYDIDIHAEDMLETPRPLEVGDRVRLLNDVERYPHFIAPKGAAGTVVDIEDPFRVKLDKPLDGADDWDNEVHWSDGADPDPLEDLERL